MEVRREIDNRGNDGQFILTGSASPPNEVNRHIGAGRFSFVQMRPMSMYESQSSTGKVSLRNLLDGQTATAADNNITIPNLAEIAVKGGWPLQQKRSVEDAHKAAKDYLRQTVEADINAATEVRNPRKLTQLIRAIARNITTDRSVAKLGQEIGGSDSSVHAKTVTIWLEALQRI